jgi:hypothetical protein
MTTYREEAARRAGAEHTGRARDEKRERKLTVAIDRAVELPVSGRAAASLSVFSRASRPTS